MADHTPSSTTEYVNNPFFVATKGINKLFLGAQGIAIMLVIVSILSRITSFQNQAPAPTDPAKAPHFVMPPTEVIIWGIFFGLIAFAIVVVLWVLISGMSAYAAAHVTRGETVTFKEALQATWKHFVPFLWLQVLTGLKVFGWSLLFIIPGVIMAVRYSLANVAFFDKDLRGNAAIKESLALTKGSFITTFASSILFNMITFGILNQLVSTATSAVLYRQFSDTPLEQRPQTHGLSVATMLLFFLFAILLVLGVFFLFQSFANYLQTTPR